MSPTRLRAKRTDCLACSSTCSGVMRSFFSICSGLVAMKVWMRARLAPLRASAARAMSRSLARESEQIVESLMWLAINCTASKSPLELAAKPASITSTFRRSSWRAMRSFSSRVIEAPGDCSPSRKVVSKMINLSAMWFLLVPGGEGWPATAIPGAQNKRPVARADGPVWKKCARARYCLRPWEDSSRASANDFMDCNVAQVGAPCRQPAPLPPSFVQAALIGLIGGGADDAGMLAPRLAPGIDDIAAQPVHHEHAEQDD